MFIFKIKKMFHPILNKFWKLLIYIFLWILLGSINFTILYLIFSVDLTNSIIDSSLTVIILGIFTLGIWYYLRFNRIEEKSTINILINLAIAGIIIISIWIFSNWFLMQIIQNDKENFNSIFEKIFLFKTGFGIVIYFISTLSYYLMIYYQNYQENVKRKNELSSMLKDSELSNLKSQINPHFLFNSLNSISYLIYTNPEDAHNSIVKLSEYFRYSLSKGDEQLTTLNDELENIFRYLDIEKIRFTEKMIVEKQIDTNCLKHKIPVMILQPLIENAVKHGVYENTEKTIISIVINDNSDFYSVSISNNFEKNFNKRKGTSTGLKNVSQRLKLMYKRDDLILIKESENKFEVKISFPKTIIL
jgi:two-component system, LytTR family, sensor kinase